ncbi:PREDICTED: uncharacterized protein LOC108620332 [Drosophila arizonae]|uniref:Uncharacterized protein LOC108620332 n=1 Tax=Drosophila arizonae TaxID=7263 RepID=A0ABM1PZU0_DROAR|nr:PREDICTED: uncharacterized protein LOC108620332 [Drosophila arizonae]
MFAHVLVVLVICMWMLDFGADSRNIVLSTTPIITILKINPKVFAPAKKKIKYRFTLPLSLALPLEQRQELMDNCSSFGSPCQYAENCCTLLCLRHKYVCVS